MKRRLRITRRRDFDRLLKNRRLYAGEALVGFGAPGGSNGVRVGVTTSRQLRGAVARNRARRRLREAARARLLADDSPDRLEGSIDIVLIARSGALELPFEELAEEVARVGRRLREAGR
jgi:ribonuclease P protein component